MKLSKTLLLIAFAGIISLSLGSCKKKCKGDPPLARLINNTNSVASLQIQPATGNAVNIDNVAPGATSDYSSFVTGDIAIIITVNKNTFAKNASTSFCNKYDIAIDSNNNISINVIHVKYPQ